MIPLWYNIKIYPAFLRKSLWRSGAALPRRALLPGRWWQHPSELADPHIEQSRIWGSHPFPAFIGFWSGVLRGLLLDQTIPTMWEVNRPRVRKQPGHHHDGAGCLPLHNIPEEMAVGVVYAGSLREIRKLRRQAHLSCPCGAIQNFPEGAIISMLLRAEGERGGPSVLAVCFRRCRAYRRGADASSRRNL